MRYFIIGFDDTNIKEIQNVIFGSLSGQRQSVDGSCFVASLYEGDKTNYDFMKHLKEYTYNEILTELNNPFWVMPTP